MGSVTPKACSRSSPVAIFGRNARFCSSLPKRSSVPIVYIWAWQPLPLLPLRCISSRIAQAAAIGSPWPPYSVGISAERYPCLVRSSTNSLGYARSRSLARQYSPGYCLHSDRTASLVHRPSASICHSSRYLTSPYD